MDDSDHSLYRLNLVEVEQDELRSRTSLLERQVLIHEEQITGERGINHTLKGVSAEMAELRASINRVGVGIILAAVAFAINALQGFFS